MNDELGQIIVSTKTGEEQLSLNNCLLDYKFFIPFSSSISYSAHSSRSFRKSTPMAVPTINSANMI